MGKAKSWFKRLVAKIRSDANPKDKRNLGKSYTNEADSRRIAAEANSSSSSAPEVTGYGTDDAGKHAIAVAAASAVAADAALAAAKAAAAVVRLTSSGRCYTAPSLHITIDAAAARETSAVLVIQSHFRGYLARRALRALKGLVKLQALIRGHITRRKTAETIRRIEAMLRAQARAISLRSYGSPISSEKSSQSYLPGPQTPEKLEMTSYSRISSNTQSPILSKGSGSVSRSINRVIIHPDNSYLNSPGWSESQVNRHYRTAASCSTEEDKILEIDTGKQQHQYGFFDDPRKNLSRSIQDEEDENVFCTAQSSPQLCSRRLSPMTPTKSDTSAASCRSGYSDCPSYMAYTESSRARMRASSAPRQRPEQCSERAGSRKTASSAAARACFASKAYTGSGRHDRLGVPIGNNANVYFSGCLN